MLEALTTDTTAEECLTLEPLKEAHALELYDLLQDPRLYTYMPINAPASRAKLAERYRWLELQRSPDGTEIWLNWVIRNSDGSPVGLLEATVLPDLSSLIAYTVFTNHWGNHYGRGGVQMLLKVLAKDYHVTKAVALVDTRNQASIKLLERTGFSLVEHIKDADHFKGSSSDEYRFERSLGDLAVV